MLVICPNCKKEFIVGEEIVGECPNCHIKLIFRGENEIVEKVDIRKIEEKVDEITSENVEISLPDKILIESLELKDISHIEEKIDKLIS